MDNKLSLVIEFDANNGYPKEFINSVIQQTLHTQAQRENTEKYVHLKLPLIDEELKRRALSIVRRTGRRPTTLTKYNF